VLYVPGVSGRSAGEILVLDDDETRHLRALRAQSGTGVRLTDGAGSMWAGRLTALRGRTAECVLEGTCRSSPRLPVELAFAVGNKAHVLWLVEKATEMGVGGLQPLEATRSRSVTDAGRSPAFWGKARRRAVAAMKQSGGAWLPVIGPPSSVQEYVEAIGRRGRAELSLKVRLDGAGDALLRVLAPWDGIGRVVLVVGPEGGWSLEEMDRFDAAGFLPASVGRLVLRFETAALAGLAVLAQHIPDDGAATGGPSDGSSGG
jgi:16S rRNA (uracil1498-N3)-methyltransferase